jgi:thioredoxin reductase
MGWLASALKALAETLHLINRRNELKNAPDVRDRAKAQQQVNRDAEIDEAIRTRDLEKLRKMGAE